MARTRFSLLLILFLLCGIGSAAAAGGKEAAYPKGGKWDLRKEQHAHFPLPLPAYTDPEHAAFEGEEGTLWDKLRKRAVAQNHFNLIATIIFACAILHTFLSGVFTEMAHAHEDRHRKIIEQKKTKGSGQTGG